MLRNRLRFPARAGLLACAVGMVAFASPVLAQEPPGELTPAPGAPQNFDPSDVYFQGWLLTRDAEQLEGAGKHSEALDKMLRARELFGSVGRYFPLWRPEMVTGRIAKTQETIDRVGPLALEENSKRNRRIAELEGNRSEGVIQGESPRPLEVPPTRSLETLESSRIAELESRVKELESEIASPPAAAPANKSAGDSRAESRMRDMSRQRDLARSELQRANEELAKLRQKIEMNPVQQELRNVQGQLQRAEQQKNALAEALSQSQQETRTAKAQMEALNAERARLAQKAADLERNLEQERKSQMDVIAAQQKQLRGLQEQLRAKNDELAQANQRIAGLEQDLNSLRTDYKELKDERDSLLRERDQMKELLASDEGQRIQLLIDDNIRLDRQLREAREQVDRIDRNQHATQEELIDANFNLAIAKETINAFKREKAAQDKRLADLEGRLRNEVGALSAPGGDPAEAEMLRSIIQKQLRVQERRRQAAELFVDAVGDKAQEDEEIRRALDLFKGSELTLSPQEMKLLQARRVDGDFISPVRRTTDEVNASVAELETSNRPYIDASTRAFLAERYQSSRELFQMVLERNPGDTATMCRLGVVHLKLAEPSEAAKLFRDATLIDSNNPYAHRMLGYALRDTGDLQEAQGAARRSVELDPTDPGGRLLLGALCFDLGQEEEAEKELKAAVEFDDALYQPYFNLAYLYAKQGRKELGLKFYEEAVKRGAPASEDLERRLAR